MSQIQQTLSGPWAVRLGWTLVHSLWQIAVVAVIVASLLALLRRRSAQARYLVACVGLAAMLVPPVVTYSLPSTEPDIIDSPIAMPATVAEETLVPLPPLSRSAVESPPPALVPVSVDTGDAAHADASSPAAPVPSLPEGAGETSSRWVPWLAACWILGVLALSIRNLGGWFAAWRLKRFGTMPIPEPWPRRFSELKTRLRVGLPVRLVQSVLVEVPVVVGWLRPVILMPVGILTGFSPHEIEAMLAHELAHVRRLDGLVNLLQTVAETLLFYHPAVWWLSRRIRTERENCCDDVAVAACGSRPLYARTLTALVARCGAPRAAVAADGGNLVARVRRILGKSSPAGGQPAAWLAGLVVLVSLTVLSVALYASAQAGNAGEPSETETALAEVAESESSAGPEPQAPAGARVTLLLDRQEFLLGENITVCYRLENVGREPLRSEKGGHYPTLRRNDGYAITMTPIDAEGKEIGKPLEPVPEPENLGGPETQWELKPGEVYQQTLYLPRYVRLDQPGRYRLRVVNRDRLAGLTSRGRPSAKEVFSVGETTIALRAPTPQEAREVYERMKKLPQGPVAGIGERRDQPIADFEALIHPVYLPMLREHALGGGREALVGLGKMWTPEANAALVEVIDAALGKNDLDFALAAYHRVAGMPDPRWYPGFYPDPKAHETPEAIAKREFVARTWRPQFAATLRRLAGRLARDPKSTGLEEIARIYERVGTAADMPDLAAAYSKSIAATKTLPLERQYFRPRGSAYIYRFAAMGLLKRGAQPAREPQTPGEAAVYLIAMRQRKDFRPEDWATQVVRWLRHETPYMRELVLEYMPEPIPEAALQEIPKLLADDYVDLQIAACHTARKHPREAFRQPLVEILRKGKEEHLLNAATEAAEANAITRDLIMQGWLDRMDNSDLGGKALVRLLLSVLDDNRAQSTDKLDPDVQAAAKARWERFIRENREKLRQGHRFKLGDPEITPDLFPRGFQFYFQGKPWPPVQAEASPAAVTIAGEPAKDESAAKPWVVTGKVTDQSGNGLPGVTVRANCGWGTLRPTGQTVTANDGTYTLRFAPGIGTLDEKTKKWRAGVQAANVYPSKPGYYERNLHRQGLLMMADEILGEKGLGNRYYPRPDQTVLPGKPLRVDFVMSAAARVEVQLVDQQDKPLADTQIWIAGRPRQPASSVLASGQTDQAGKIGFGEVPLQNVLGLAARGPNDSRDHAFSLPIVFMKPGQFSIKLRWVPEPGGPGRLDLVSLTDAKNRDARGEAVLTDPARTLMAALTDPGVERPANAKTIYEYSEFLRMVFFDFANVSPLFDKEGNATEMTLCAGWVNDDVMREFQRLPRLESLALNGAAEIGDEGLAHLGRLTEIKHLSLPTSKVTDKGLAHLVNLKKLESLRLWSGRITDEGLKTISGIEGLKSLTLFGGSNVTEAGLQHLAGMKQLNYLHIAEATLSPAAIDRLKHALPRCQVSVTPKE